MRRLEPCARAQRDPDYVGGRLEAMVRDSVEWYRNNGWLTPA